MMLSQQKQESWTMKAHGHVDVLQVPFENRTSAAYMCLQFLSFTPNLKKRLLFSTCFNKLMLS